MERLAKQAKSQKNERDLRELRLLERCRAFLEEEKPLREFAFEREDELLVRGFRFLTQKPLIVVVNIDEGAISGETEIRRLFAGQRQRARGPRSSAFRPASNARSNSSRPRRRASS